MGQLQEGGRLASSQTPVPDTDANIDELIARARKLAPVLREAAANEERERRVSEETIREAEFFFPTLVPRVWGGRGLGLRAHCEVTRELAHGDPSAAWTISFMMQHNWMACRLATMEAQAELFAQQPFIRAAAPLNPTGTAERVEGGFRVSGRFPYASAIWNSDWTLLHAKVPEDGSYVLMVPVSDVTVNDDWFMSGMAATGSSTVMAESVFVPERMCISFDRFVSADRHRGVTHEEPYMRYPFLAAVDYTSPSVALGAAEACVEIARERLHVAKVFGTTPRVDLPLSRVRWAMALQRVKCAQLLWRSSIARTIELSESGEWTDPDFGHSGLDSMTVVQLSQEAISLVCDGMGSSAYQLSDPLQRYRRDIDVVANHRAHDHDTVADASTRAILGISENAADLFAGRAPVGAVDAAQRAGEADDSGGRAR